MINENNKIMAHKISDLNYCVAELARRGLSITAIEIKDRKPVITIDSSTKTPGGLKGGLLMQITEGGRHWETYATELEGCQVQWKVAA